MLTNIASQFVAAPLLISLLVSNAPALSHTNTHPVQSLSLRTNLKRRRFIFIFHILIELLPYNRAINAVAIRRLRHWLHISNSSARCVKMHALV